MLETVARLNALTRNIERYQSLLTTNLSDLEVQYIQMRLSEEQLKLAALRSECVAPENIELA